MTDTATAGAKADDQATGETTAKTSKSSKPRIRKGRRSYTVKEALAEAARRQAAAAPPPRKRNK